MKVFKDGKEVKEAKVVFDTSGNPAVVQMKGINYDPAAFEFKDEESKTKTKEAPKQTAKESPKNESVLTTKDTRTAKKN